MSNNKQQEDRAQLWQAYRGSFRQFAKQAAALDLAQEQNTLKWLELEEARSAYGRARDAVAISLFEARESPARLHACAC